ncbi:MAG TPA: translation initiation factor IF-3 [Planctomycetota bacterium]|nr:translation initiation factor IF-3 [Planctomycetota bacterium]
MNNQIRIREVRLVGADGTQHGVVPIEEARRLADEAGLDLVEVAPNARPPVCRILDYGKFKYQQKKNEQKSRTHQSQLKEIRVRPGIDDHDLGYKIGKAREFLEAGDKVQVNCMFRGREMTHLELGRRVIDVITSKVSDIAKVERGSKLEGRRMTILLTKR